MKPGTVVQHVNDRADISPVGLVMSIDTHKITGKEVASVVWDSGPHRAPLLDSLYSSWEFTNKLVMVVEQ